MNINEITKPSREQQVEEAYLYLGRMIEYVENDTTLFESQRQQLNELGPLALLAFLGTGVGAAASGYDLYRSHNQYMRKKREAGDDPAALAAAEKYWDKVKDDAAIEAVIGGLAGGATGGTFSALRGGYKGLKAAKGAGVIKKAKDAITNLFNRPKKELRNLQRQMDDPEFQQQLQKVQQKMANDNKGPSTPVLRADPADRNRISGSGAIGTGIGAVTGAGKGVVKNIVGRGLTGAAAGPAVLGPNKKNELDIFNQNSAGNDPEDTENRLRKPTTPTPAPSRITN